MEGAGSLRLSWEGVWGGENCGGAQAGQAPEEEPPVHSGARAGAGPPPAAHFSFLLGKVDLQEASPPYTLWLPELAPSQHRQHRGGGADLLQDPRAGVSSGGWGV